MSETLTAAAVPQVLPASESQFPQDINLPPLLRLSQEEQVMRDFHLSSHSQVSKQYTLHNCNIIFQLGIFRFKRHKKELLFRVA